VVREEAISYGGKKIPGWLDLVVANEANKFIWALGRLSDLLLHKNRKV